MGRIVDLDDLVNAEAIALRCGITRQAVDLWTKRDTFPEPINPGSHGRIWIWPDVVAWREAYPSRPRDLPEHGRKTTYNQGCRCDECRAANAEYTQKFIANHRGQLPDGDQRHGTTGGYSNYSCRCGPCTAANSAASAKHKAKVRAAHGEAGGQG